MRGGEYGGMGEWGNVAFSFLLSETFKRGEGTGETEGNCVRSATEGSKEHAAARARSREREKEGDVMGWGLE